jgi:hypothetical protein
VDFSRDTRRRSAAASSGGGFTTSCSGHLVTVAALAAAEQPGLAEHFELSPGNASNEAFRTHAHKMLEQGQAQKELLARHGLADKLLEDLAAAVGDLDESVEESNEGRRDHVGARADLKAVSDEVIKVVQMLDGLNRYRFSGNAELLAAWESARKVMVGPRTAEEPQAETPKAEGEVRPAA